MDKQGLYQKYEIKKTDGSPVDPKAEYFVLRLDTDKHAISAVAAYARSVHEDNPQFADELIAWVLDVVKTHYSDTTIHIDIDHMETASQMARTAYNRVNDILSAFDPPQDDGL